MDIVTPRPSPGGALLYVRCFWTAAPPIGGNCTTRGFDTPATRRKKASCSAKPPSPPSWSAPADPEGPAPVPMSGARALRPATGTSTTPEHNTTRPTTTTPGPLGTKLSLLTRPRRVSGTKLAQHEPHGPTSGTKLAQQESHGPTSGTKLAQHIHPRRMCGTKLSPHTRPRRISGTKLSPHTRNSSIWRFFCMQGEFCTVLTTKKPSRENFVPNARRSRGKPRQHSTPY